MVVLKQDHEAEGSLGYMANDLPPAIMYTMPCYKQLC